MVRHRNEQRCSDVCALLNTKYMQQGQFQSLFQTYTHISVFMWGKHA